jgi:hypothetical protein
MEPIKYISPSSFFYWEQCPLRAVYSKKYRDEQTFPKHPDSDLGALIHRFLENQITWNISSVESFDEKWEYEINKLDTIYRQSKMQNIYFPIKWNSKYFAVKKLLLKKIIFKEIKPVKSKYSTKSKFEQWIDDGDNVGGKIDLMIYNGKDEIVEIVDFKTGNIFELFERRKVLKRAYIQQQSLYAYLVKIKQNYYPKCYVQNITGNKFEVEIIEDSVNDIYLRAIDLKTTINKGIEYGNVDQLAKPYTENCYYCDFRPFCKSYKSLLINCFEHKHVDIYGFVMEVKGLDKLELVMDVEGRTITLKNITSLVEVQRGEYIYVYNLFSPDRESNILFAMTDTIIIDH